eukprot:gene7963-1179_t
MQKPDQSGPGPEGPIPQQEATEQPGCEENVGSTSHSLLKAVAAAAEGGGAGEGQAHTAPTSAAGAEVNAGVVHADGIPSETMAADSTLSRVGAAEGGAGEGQTHNAPIFSSGAEVNTDVVHPEGTAPGTVAADSASLKLAAAEQVGVATKPKNYTQLMNEYMQR